MRIVVLGAGTVGTWIADLLCQQRHSVTVVDNDPAHTQRINAELDVKAITGAASNSSVLFQADVIGADVCLAVTGVDEVNLVAASIAKSMGCRRSVARTFGPVFRNRSTFDYERHFNIDRLLSLERLAALELAHGIRSPDSLAVENLADGKLEVAEISVSYDSSALNKPLKDMKIPAEVRFGTIQRDDKMWVAKASDVIQLGDRVTVIGQHGEIAAVRKTLQRKLEKKLDIVIAGGGETGLHLASLFEDKRYCITLLESDIERCEFLASCLPHVTVVQADATRRSVLEEERIGSADVFAACIGDDENNIVTCVEAKELGTETILAIVSRPDYANVVAKLGIDLAVSPRNVMAKQILSFMNKGPVFSRSMLGGGNIGIYEIDVREGAEVTRFDLLNLPFPSTCLILAVIRDDFVRIPRASDRLKPGDRVVVLVEGGDTEEMLELFQATL